MSMLKDVEKALLELDGADNTPEQTQEALKEIIRTLPEKNAQGMIQDRDLEAGNVEILSTVDITETDLVYTRYGHRPAQKDGLKITAKLDGSHIAVENIPRDAELEETP